MKKKINISCPLHHLPIDFYCSNKLCKCRKTLCSTCKNDHILKYCGEEYIVCLKDIKNSIYGYVNKNNNFKII